MKDAIAYELENVFGRKITSLRDCIELSEDIFIKTNCKLNPNTLRRFFNLVKAEYQASKSTLDILAKYCGFESVNDLYKVKNIESLEIGTLNQDTVLHLLVSFFNGANTVIDDGPIYLSMAKNVIKFLNEHTFLTDRFQNMVSKFEMGRHYYFERFVNVDKLNSFYGNGLRYYQLEEETLEAKVFTTSLYLFKYWLNADDEKLLDTASNLKQLKIDHSISPFTMARYFIGILFYNNIAKLNNDAIFIDIRNCYMDFISHEENIKNIYHFTCIISNALLLTGHSTEALVYIEQTKVLIEEKYHSKYQNQDHYSLYLLLQAHACYNTGRHKEALKIFEQIKSSEFPFLKRQYSFILYISLLQKIKPKQDHTKRKYELSVMVEETGFKKLQYV